MKPLIVPFFISHQGCPHQCVFCDQRRIAGHDGGLPSATELRERIARFTASSDGRPVEVAFYGGTFTSLSAEAQERLLAPLQPLIASGEVMTVRLSTRPDAVDGEAARFLRSRGVRTVELGVQSMDDRVLAASGRGHTADHVVQAFASLREAGIAVGAQLMPGLPGDTKETSLASLQRVLALSPACLRIYPTVVLEGTRLAEFWRGGSYTPLGMEEAVSLCAAMLRVCLLAGVPVIRIGLQPTEELEASGTMLAGPWHPAFRQLVEGELWYDCLDRLMVDVPAGATVSLVCAPSRVSDVTGQRRKNLERLRERRGILVTRVTGSADLTLLDIALIHAGGTVAGNLLAETARCPSHIQGGYPFD
ncbi:MAG: radical SAM protein [Desulfuromonadales bacterium]|nr:MAG: radical SAM protein [Desulfuromonadales bacterium]